MQLCNVRICCLGGLLNRNTPVALSYGNTLASSLDNVLAPAEAWAVSRLAWSVTLPSGHQTRPDDRHQKSSGQVLWTPGRGCTPKIPQFSLDLALQILSRHFSLIIWLPPGFSKTQHWFEFDLRNIWLVSPLPKFIRGWLVCLSLWPIRFTTWSLIKAHGQEHVGWSVPF